jgi:hypothetical protein
MFKSSRLDPLALRRVSTVRTDTRALIRLANAAESSPPPSPRKDGLSPSEPDRALVRAETRLTASITEALAARIGIGAIVSDIVAPVLRDAVVVGQLAREAVARAVNAAGLGPGDRSEREGAAARLRTRQD